MDLACQIPAMRENPSSIIKWWTHSSAAHRIIRPKHRQSGEFLDLGSQFSAGIAGVDDLAGLEQQYHGFGIGLRTVLDAAGDDEELPRREDHVAVSHLNGELSVEDQEELVGVGVPVPGELALDFTILTS